MKTMTSLKQRILTAISFALVIMTLAVCAPEQALANGRGRASANVRQGQSAPRNVGGGRHNNAVVNRTGPATKGKYGPKKPLGVWVWVEAEKSYVWM